jgi:hypothetical protein
MRRPAGFAALVVCAAAAVVAGCGGGGGGDTTKSLTPEQILQRARESARTVTSYRLNLDATIQAKPGTGSGAATVRRLLANPLKVSGQGPVKTSGDASLDVATQLGPIPLQLNVTKVGGGLYVTVLGQDLKLTLPPATVRRLNVDALRTAPLDWMTQPTEVGREKVDGVDTVHLRGSVDTSKAGPDITQALQSLGLGGAASRPRIERAAAQVKAGLKKGTVDAWIGEKDFQTRQLAAMIRESGKVDALPQVRALSLDLKEGFTHLNEPVTVTAPAHARPVDPSKIFSQLGG